jgi:type IV secretory pathway VirB2 component (pilin)
MQTQLFTKGKTSVKSIRKTSIYLAMVAMLLMGAFTGSAAAAGKPVPFSGSLQALEHSVFQGPPPGILVVDASGSGIATLFGQFTLTWNFIVNIADGTGAGPVSFTAANGDAIFSTSFGRSEPTDTPGVFHIVEIQTITGGTGRFAGAQGSFIVDRLTDLNTGLTSGSFHGTITSPGAAR